ncbi:hypothetical protein L249_8076 [Ophiocordyceps polyrhachis-furcata BCC 54312]|uniref:Nodulin-like domain-containing protein n=1 Tax=Ophiocordyceps polyrhachis-furcata BCC 54312 TaxID=1330021 RepID=A0A367LI44_9HYPO|nr:hypothetical protein L249_8076 [Ophiocordyceps polyrhachis-furcata BCC 54312]
MGQDDEAHRGSRVVASVAATLISIACGTNYVYSAWAPQFAERLGLSSTESNLVGAFGNLGIYSLGVPVGIFLDRSGPRPFVLLGSVLLAAGYFPLHQAYDFGSGSVPILCFFSFVTGLGSCMAFAAAVKTSALNWPHHRGTATAFPLAAFGLSAFFFSFLGSVFFPGDPSAFLKLLSWGTFSCTFVGFFFLRTSSPHHDQRQRQRRRASSDAAKPFLWRPEEPGTSGSQASQASPDEVVADETSSLIAPELVPTTSVDMDLGRRLDVRGLRLLRTRLFWLLFSIMALLAGVGLMTINRIWCLVVACVVFLAGQSSALVVQNPHFLSLVSGFSGLGYGLLFGVLPSIVTEAFGIRGLSQNWGFMTLAPVLSSSVFNLFYGQVYDRHSVIDSHGRRYCLEGIVCYYASYWASFAACCVGLVVALHAIRHERMVVVRIEADRDGRQA